MKTHYIESRRKQTSYIEYNEGRLAGLVAFCVGTASKHIIEKI
jgi:hypothetical protein